MGKDWDKAVPSVEIWRECLRVLKPGGFAFIMSAPRQDVLSQMIMRIGEAGFNTSFTSIYWTYASGFPKAMNIGKMVDKRNGTERDVVGRNPNSRENCDISNTLYESGTVGKTAYVTKGNSPLEGSYGGFQPKPAVEVIIVAMKPLSEKTYVDQALKNGKGITWLDDGRIPFTPNDAMLDRKSNTDPSEAEGFGVKGTWFKSGIVSDNGRFPANLLVSDDVLNDGRVTKSGDPDRFSKPMTTEGYGFAKHGYTPTAIGGDSGSYSRYFDLDKWWAKTFPFLIVPKASKSEKNEGVRDNNVRAFQERKLAQCATCGNKGLKTGAGKQLTCGHETIEYVSVSVQQRGNNHPTVKPLKLMSYLITLGSRPGDVVLDPFMGSGTTGVAAKQLRRNFIGIELDKDYHAIAKARIDAVLDTIL